MAIVKRALNEIEDPFLNLMFVADPGVGKTSAAMTMANLGIGGKIYVIDSDSLISNRALQSIGIPTDKIEVFSIDTFEDVRTLVIAARKKLAEDPGSIGGFVVDTMSELSKKLTTNLAFDRYTKNTKLRRQDNQFDIDVKEHGQVVEQLRFLARAMRDLPCHTVFTAHPKEDKEPDGTIYYRAGFGPKFATDLTKFCHAVIYMDTEIDGNGNLVRVGYTDPYGKYRGKDNLNCLPTKMLNPTFERIAQVVRGDLATDDVDANKVDTAA